MVQSLRTYVLKGNVYLKVNALHNLTGRVLCVNLLTRIVISKAGKGLPRFIR